MNCIFHHGFWWYRDNSRLLWAVHILLLQLPLHVNQILQVRGICFDHLFLGETPICNKFTPCSTSYSGEAVAETKLTPNTGIPLTLGQFYDWLIVSGHLRWTLIHSDELESMNSIHKAGKRNLHSTNTKLMEVRWLDPYIYGVPSPWTAPARRLQRTL